MGRRPSIIVAAAGVGAAVGLLLIGRPTPAPAQIEGAAGDLEARVRETAAMAQARATTLAGLPRLSWAVATDENTMLDLTADELAFQPQPGEFIEIGQVRRRDGKVTSLRKVGTTAVLHLPLAEPGAHLIAAGDELHAASIVSVTPKERAGVLTGAVGVSRRIELGPVAARLAQAGLAARLETPQGSVTIGNVIGGAVGARERPRTLHGELAGELRVVLLLPASNVPSAGYLVAAGLLLVLSLGGAAVLWRRGAPVVPDPRLPELVSQAYVDLSQRPASSRRPRG